MVWGVRRTYRRAAAAFALLGVAFYALLLPWHLTSQFEAQLFKAEFGTLADVICASGGSAAPDIPGAPASNCPICKGLAAFHYAIAPAAQAELAAPLAIATTFDHLRQDLIGASVATPRNRGPPSLPA